MTSTMGGGAAKPPVGLRRASCLWLGHAELWAPEDNGSQLGSAPGSLKNPALFQLGDCAAFSSKLFPDCLVTMPVRHEPLSILFTPLPSANLHLQYGKGNLFHNPELE